MGKLGVDPSTGLQFPHIGSTNVSLDAALDRCRSAEAALDSAREIARAAARRAGKGTSALFAKSSYVLRDSAIKWCDEARSEGSIAGAERLATAFERAFRPESEKRKDPFYNLAQAMVRRGVAGRDIGDAPVDPVEARQAEIRASRRVDLSANRAIGAPTESRSAR